MQKPTAVFPSLPVSFTGQSLISHPGVFGQLPSNATVSRFFERTVTNPELFGYGFETLTRELRTGPGTPPGTGTRHWPRRLRTR